MLLAFASGDSRVTAGDFYRYASTVSCLLKDKGRRAIPILLRVSQMSRKFGLKMRKGSVAWRVTFDEEGEEGFIFTARNVCEIVNGGAARTEI